MNCTGLKAFCSTGSWISRDKCPHKRHPQKPPGLGRPRVTAPHGIFIAVMSKGTSRKRVTHTGLCLSTLPGLLGQTSPNKPVESHTGYANHRGAYVIEASKWWVQSPGSRWRWQVESWAAVSSPVAAVVACIQWSGSPAGLPA